MRKVAVLIFVLIISGCVENKPLVVSGATLIDGTGGSINDSRVIVVEQHITCVGSAAECEVPPGSDILDATGFWVIPGLIDVHIGPVEMVGDERQAYLRFLLGVTTAGSVTDGTEVLETDTSILVTDDHRLPVPRIVPFEEPRTAVFEKAVLATSPTDIDVAVLKSPARDSMVLVMRSWLKADVANLTDSARLSAVQGVWLAPSLLEKERWARPYRLPHGLHRLLQLPMVTQAIQDRMPDRTETEARDMTAALEVFRAFIREFHEAGGSVVTATRGALTPGLDIHEEMRALVSAGLSPEEALYAGTREAAEALGISSSRGTIQVGKLGDFLILEGDPRLDIANTQTVSRVVKGGVLYDPPTIFDALLEEPGKRVTGSGLRLAISSIALLATLVFLWSAIVRHRRKMSQSRL